MTKAELITRIVDAMVDPWTDDPEDYLDATPIDRSGACDLLDQIRDDEESADLEPDERLPEEVTPALVMEAYNCLIRARKFEARTERLAEWIADNDPVCEYCNYYYPEHDDAVDIIPVDFLYNSVEFPFATKHMEHPDVIEVLRIGLKSAKTFNPNHEYCWFDEDTELLHSTDAPFRDGTLDAEAFARFILTDPDTFHYMFWHIIDDEVIPYILGCTKEEYINE